MYSLLKGVTVVSSCVGWVVKTGRDAGSDAGQMLLLHAKFMVHGIWI